MSLDLYRYVFCKKREDISCTTRHINFITFHNFSTEFCDKLTFNEETEKRLNNIGIINNNAAKYSMTESIIGNMKSNG